MEIPKLDALLKDAEGTMYTQAVCRAQRGGSPFYHYTAACAEDAVFDLASLSKLLCTAMIFRLIAQKRLELDTALYEVLGGAGTFPCGPATAARLSAVTVREALLHASGLPAWYPFYTGAAFWPTLEGLLADAVPEEGMVYSDINFILLGMAAEHAARQPLAAQLAEINQLLDTRFCYNPQNPAACVPTEYGNRVEMSMCAERGLVFHPLPPQRTAWRDTAVQIQGQANDGNAFYAFGGAAGHAGVFGTAKDVLALGEAFLASARGGGPFLQPLAEAALADAGAGRALGFEVGEMFPHGVGHTGFTGTALWLCPQKNCCAALLASRLALDGPPNLQALRGQVFRLLYEAAG